MPAVSASHNLLPVGQAAAWLGTPLSASQQPTWQHPAPFQQRLQQRAQRSVWRQLGKAPAATCSRAVGRRPAGCAASSAAPAGIAEGGQGCGTGAAGPRVAVPERQPLQHTHCRREERTGRHNYGQQSGFGRRPCIRQKWMNTSAKQALQRTSLPAVLYRGLARSTTPSVSSTAIPAAAPCLAAAACGSLTAASGTASSSCRTAVGPSSGVDGVKPCRRAEARRVPAAAAADPTT